jgi:arylsulfatase A-like enzyme/Flp pilus assembly protein TadD
MNDRWTAAIAAGGLLLAGCSHAPPPASVPAPNVLLITIDTLRADRVSPSLTPAFESVAARGARFTTARSAVPLTLPSHASIMTGELPPGNGVRLNGATLAGGHSTLARLFREAGYRTGAFVGAYVLNRRYGLADGFDTYDDRVVRDPSGSARLEAERRGDAVVDATLPWLAASTADQASAAPFFAWIHLYDPHAPYDPPAAYLEKAGGRAYEGEIAFADAQVARVLDWLKASGRLDSTIVAIAGDHGEGLGDHGEQTHGMLLFDSTLRVPLAMAGPGISPQTIAEPVTIIQIAATLLALANRPPSESMAEAFPLSGLPRVARTGRGPRPDLYAETQYPAVAGWHPLVALVDGHMKLIVSSGVELYDVGADPDERHDAGPAHAVLVAALRRRAGDLSARTAPSAVPSAGDASERLRALGYVSGGAAPVPDTAPNPATHIGAWNSFEKELTRLADGDAKHALPGLTALAGSYRDAPVFQSTYARALNDVGRSAQALAVYRKLVARWPQDAALYHDLAVAAAATGDTNEAIRAERASLALDPANAAASNGLGLALVQRGDTAGAVAAFERAAHDDPTNAVFWTNLGNARRSSDNAAGAEQAYRTALDADPRSADAANGMGVLLVQGGKPADAVSWFERALAGSPRFTEARLNLGIAYQESGSVDKAIDAYRTVLAASAPGSHEHEAAATLLTSIAKVPPGSRR